MEIMLWHDALTFFMQTESTGAHIISCNGKKYAIKLLSWRPALGSLICIINNQPYQWQLLCTLPCVCYRWYNVTHDLIITLQTKAPSTKKTTDSIQQFNPHLKSPLHGKILKMLVDPGTFVEKDTPLVVIESMKMENEIRAPHNAFIKTIPVQLNDVIEADQLLIVFTEKGTNYANKTTPHE